MLEHRQTPDLSDYHPSGTLATAETMPSRWYTDAAFLELEKEKVFWKTWQPVGRADMVARPGDYFTCDVVGEPLVITRGTDGKLKAFFNVCAHRAGPVASGKGNRKSLQCKYHGWTYTLDGKLMNAPEFDGVENWDKSAVCLQPVRVVEWGPFIFVNLDDSAPDFMEVYGSIDEEIRRKGFDIGRMRAMERRDYYIDCNWKVYVDNYLEGYHVPIAHPGLYRELDYEQYRVDTFRYYSSQYAPIRPSKDGDIQGRDRRYVRTEAEAEALYYWIFPNTMLNVYPDNMSINIILPVGHDKTLTIFEWYFEEPGTGDGWESMQQTIAFSDEIQQEDIEICETVQKGLQSRAYDRGRFSVKRENGVHHFQSLIHEFLTK
ncbi:MAG: Rieske 2Fe-2S domain-containing protein [Pleurocapsa minor GSE-CHR-MK-17-07R]|jgi:choline monooxygenase|nr:Rieske 2Fe-2S domain-containing protein [Pleurocapsa minor GSE-CHR-MK 17-07R]